MRVILIFGIDENRNAEFARCGNQGAANLRSNCTFRIIRDHESVGAWQQLERGLNEAVIVGLCAGLYALEIEAKHLLAAAQDAGLCDGRKPFALDEMRCDAVGRKAGGKKALIFVVARESGNHGLRAQMRHIHGDVCRSTRFLVLVDTTHHGDRRLRRDAAYFTPDVLVEHYVAHHQQALVAPFVLDLLDYLMQLADHRVSFTDNLPLPGGFDGLAEGCCYHNGVGDSGNNPFKGNLQTIFLDRDGVLNEKMPEGRWVSAWEEFHVLPGVPETIARLNDAGLRVIVVSNQRGIALGVVSLADVEAIQLRFEDLLAEQGARVDAFYVCPHDRLECNCRKPLAGNVFAGAKGIP